MVGFENNYTGPVHFGAAEDTALLLRTHVRCQHGSENSRRPIPLLEGFIALPLVCLEQLAGDVAFERDFRQNAAISLCSQFLSIKHCRAQIMLEPFQLPPP